MTDPMLYPSLSDIKDKKWMKLKSLIGFKQWLAGLKDLISPYQKGWKLKEVTRQSIIQIYQRSI